jgi:hypothetical protein
MFIDDTNASAAVRTAPQRFLLRQPPLDTHLFDPQQVGTQADVIVVLMPLIELLQVGAREILTFKAEGDLAFSYQGAIPLDPGAVFILHPATLAAMFQVFFFQHAF